MVPLQGLAGRLRNAGRDVTVVDLPDCGQGDLGVQADVLGSAVDAVLARTGARAVDVLGYSPVLSRKLGFCAFLSPNHSSTNRWERTSPPQ